MQVALALFPGVSVDECEAFTLAFDELRRQGRPVDIVGVGEAVGDVAGPGGRQRVDATFDDVSTPDVVLVPGGLGVDHTTRDEALLNWIRRVEPRCQWMAASSTGTVVVAAAGLLGDRPAATHWLAGDRLAEFGSNPSPERIVEIGRVLTCRGHVSALDVALLIILRLHNRAVATAVRSGVTASPARSASAGSRIERIARRLTRRTPRQRPSPKNRELDSAEWVAVELDELPPDQRASQSPDGIGVRSSPRPYS